MAGLPPFVIPLGTQADNRTYLQLLQLPKAWDGTGQMAARCVPTPWGRCEKLAAAQESGARELFLDKLHPDSCGMGGGQVSKGMEVIRT